MSTLYEAFQSQKPRFLAGVPGCLVAVGNFDNNLPARFVLKKSFTGVGLVICSRVEFVGVVEAAERVRSEIIVRRRHVVRPRGGLLGLRPLG